MRNMPIPKGRILLEIISMNVDFCIRDTWQGFEIAEDDYEVCYKIFWFDISVYKRSKK